MKHVMAGCALMAALLAGCQRSADAPTDESVVQNIAEPLPQPEEAPPPAPAPPPPPATVESNVAEALPAETPPSADEQMREDADAAGLTSRTATPDVVTGPSADPIGAAANGLDSGADR